MDAKARALAARYVKDCLECLNKRSAVVTSLRKELIEVLAVAEKPMTASELTSAASYDGVNRGDNATITLLEILHEDGYVFFLRDGSWFRQSVPYSIPVVTATGDAFEFQSPSTYRALQRGLKLAGHRPHRIYMEVKLRD